MRVIVTNNIVDYGKGFLKVESLATSTSILGVIDVLVYNNSSENNSLSLELLTELKNRVKVLIYICDESRTDLAIKMMVVGSGGKYFSDEFFLSDPQELGYLIDSLQEVTSLVDMNGVSVLEDFMKRYLENGDTDFNKNYLQVVKKAVSGIVGQYNEKNLEIIQMSETASDIFSNTSTLLRGMKDEQNKLKGIVQKLTESAKEVIISSPIKTPLGSSVIYFPRISYMKTKSIIRVKELGSCLYLVSFMLGLREYASSLRGIRTKLIVLTPIGECYETLYKDYKWVKQSTVNSMSEYMNDVVFTNHPNSDVLNKLLEDTDYDLFLVLDKTISDKEHILNCKGGTIRYGVSGLSAIKKFNLESKSCISSIISIDGSFLTIQAYTSYPVDPEARRRLYISEMQKNYDKLISDVRRME